jgi:integrase
LFQRRFPSEIRAVSDSSLRTMLNSALVHTGLKDPADGQPLHYSPHDFRRIFITDAVMSGLPPHIAQVIAGHRDINVTMGYKKARELHQMGECPQVTCLSGWPSAS